MTVTPGPHIDDGLALNLRLRTLHTLITGTPLSSSTSSSPSPNILTRAVAIQTRLRAALQHDKALLSFLDAYDHNAPYLQPSFVFASDVAAVKNQSESQSHSQQISPSADLVPAHAQAALLLEVAPELKQLERDLAECELLDKRGVTGAGKLVEHESLRPALAKAQADQATLQTSQTRVEQQLHDFLTDYQLYVDTLSRLFLTWDGALSELEARLLAEEKRRAVGR